MVALDSRLLIYYNMPYSSEHVCKSLVRGNSNDRDLLKGRIAASKGNDISNGGFCVLVKILNG
jgi:hypothetical protein